MDNRRVLDIVVPAWVKGAVYLILGSLLAILAAYAFVTAIFLL